MSLIDSASLIVTPNAYKEGKLYSVIPSDGSGDMSVVRATTATRVNSDGLVELVPYNLLQRSEEFNNAIWTRPTSTVSANIATAPDGTLTADKLVESTTNNFQNIFQVVPQINSSYTYSVYLKKGQNDRCVLFAGSTQALLWIDMTNWTSFSQTNVNSYSINAVGNDWYRVVFTYTNTSSASHQTGINLIKIGTSNTVTYAGNTSNGLFIWGAQLVEGSTALPYLKTETRLNIPRLDYSNGTCPSLLVEPQRTNLYAWSSSFDNAVWNTGNATITANTTISPSGIQDADSIFEQAVNDYQIDGQLYSMTNGVTYTMSIYVKANTRQYFRALVGNSVLINFQSAYFDLVNGVSTSTSLITTTMTDAGNGWWKCSLTFTCNNTATDAIYFGSSPNMTSAYSPFVGDPTKGVYIWGAQLEVGNYQTSYIPTTSASVTRNADVISKTGISSLIGQTEGTLFWEVQKDDIPSNTRFQLSDGTSNNWLFVSLEGVSRAIRIYAGVLGGTTVDVTSVATLNNDAHKIAFAYAQNDFQVYVDGAAFLSHTSGDIPACSKLYLGSNDPTASVIATSNIFAAALWKTRLTNDELERLTGTGFNTYAEMANYYNYITQ